MGIITMTLAMAPATALFQAPVVMAYSQPPNARTVGAKQYRVCDHLVAGSQHQEVVQHHLLPRYFENDSIAGHSCPRRLNDSEAVEQSLRPIFLHADDAIADRGEAEKGILPLAEQQQYQETATTIALNKVRTFALRISQRLLLELVVTRLTWPALMRSATSLLESPPATGIPRPGPLGDSA